MALRDDLIRGAAIHFADMVDEFGKRVHIGCMMAAGRDWVEVSMPKRLDTDSIREVRFLPSLVSHAVTVGWRASDRVGFTYVNGVPPDDIFAGLVGMSDSRSATEMRIHTPTWQVSGGNARGPN